MTVKLGRLSILFHVYIVGKREYVGGIILVHGRPRRRPDHNHGIGGISYHNNSENSHHIVEYHPARFLRIPDASYQNGCKYDKEEQKPGVVGQTDDIHEEKLEPAGNLRHARYNYKNHQINCHNGKKKRLDYPSPGHFIPAEIIDEEQDGDHKQVQPVNSKS